MIKFFGKQFAANHAELVAMSQRGERVDGVCRLLYLAKAGAEILVETPTGVPMAIFQTGGRCFAVRARDPSHSSGPWVLSPHFDVATERLLGIRGVDRAGVAVAAATFYSNALPAMCRLPREPETLAA